MTQTLEALSRRAATLQSIRGVVRTMKTLSAVNAAPYEAAAASIDRYHATILDGLRILFRVSGVPVAAETPSLQSGIILAFGSDHGLCGGYNDTVAGAVLSRMGNGRWRVFVVGAKLQAALSDRGVTPTACFTPPASADGIGRLARELLIALDSAQSERPGGEIATILVHMGYSDQGGQETRMRTLLPVDPALLTGLSQAAEPGASFPMITMAPDALFASLISNHLFASVFRAAAEAMATENSARLALMQQAEHAIDERLGELLLATRSARQSEITNELLDVIAGTEALKKR